MPFHTQYRVCYESKIFKLSVRAKWYVYIKIICNKNLGKSLQRSNASFYQHRISKLAQIAELVSSQNSSLRVLFCFVYLDQPFDLNRNKAQNGFFNAILLDTYFDATVITRNMQLFILAQGKIPTSFPRYFYLD